MTYSEIKTEFTTQATAQGFTVVWDYIDTINERASKVYPVIVFFPVASTHNYDYDKNNTTYHWEGFAGGLATVDTYDTIYGKLKAFIKSLLDKSGDITIQRIPQTGNDRLVNLRFKFDYTVTEC